MPINSGPGIGGRPGGGLSSSSFAPPSRKPAIPIPAAAPTSGAKWVITEAGAAPHASAARAPVTGSCIDILSDPWAWLCAIGGSLAVALLTYEPPSATADPASTSKWVFIGATFAGYLCAIFVAGFAVAAFLWMGTKSRWAMRLGFTLVTAAVASAPLAIGHFRAPKSSEAASSTPAAVQAESVAQPAPLVPVVEAPPPAEPVTPVVVEPAQQVEPAPSPYRLNSVLLIEPSRGPARGSSSGPRTSRNPASGRTAASSAELKIVSAELRTLLADIRTDATDLQSKLQAEGLESILAPSSFAGRSRILSSRRRLANIKRITDDYERTVMARFDEFPHRIHALHISDELKEAAVEAFQKRQAEGLQKLRAIAQLHRAILVEADRLFLFMDSRIGRFKVSDRILFQYADDAETYTAHIERLQQLGAKEERAVVENQKAALNRLASMERELAGVRP